MRSEGEVGCRGQQELRIMGEQGQLGGCPTPKG